MKNLRDIEKTYLSKYGQANVSNIKSLSNNNVFGFLTKKTEKVITALYMVTDYMDEHESIRSKLRSTGIEVLSHIYKLSVVPNFDRDAHISTVSARIHETASFLEIANSIGFISDMNSSILHRELRALLLEVENFKSKNPLTSFTLADDLFDVSRGIQYPKVASYGTTDSYKGHIKDSVHGIGPKGQSPEVSHNGKEGRLAKVMSIIKSKKNTLGRYMEISIKDISQEIPECSEKTIQRDLNSLVEGGQILKTGLKRWSRYQAIDGKKIEN